MTEPKDHKHTLTIDLSSQKATINRTFSDGSLYLYTEIDLSTKEGETQREAFSRCAQRIGEDILLDSNAGRKLFGL